MKVIKPGRDIADNCYVPWHPCARRGGKRKPKKEAKKKKRSEGRLEGELGGVEREAKAPSKLSPGADVVGGDAREKERVGLRRWHTGKA